MRPVHGQQDEEGLALHELPDEVRRFKAEPGPLAAEHTVDAFIGRSAVQYVERYADERPMYLFVGFSGPHEPWDAPRPQAEMYDPKDVPDPIAERPQGPWLSEAARTYHTFAQYYPPADPRALGRVAANYFGKITLIDEWIGQILAALERKGLLDDTLVIVGSDHGEMLGDHNRLSKSVFYESAIRVPLIVKMPGAQPPGRVYDGMVETIDLLPTILDAAGAETPRTADGRSLLPLVAGRAESQRREILSEVHLHTMLRTETCKLVVDSAGRTLQLFDLAVDPHEQANLAGRDDHAGVEREMRDRLLAKLLSTQARAGRLDPAACGSIPL